MSESKKPRICEVLGVEPLRAWMVPERGRETYRINSDGNIQRKNSKGAWVPSLMPVSLLADIINDTSLVVHKPRWTAEDIKDAKAIRRLYPNSKFVRRVKMSDGTFGIDIVRENGMATWLAVDLVSSLEAGEKVALDDILKVRE